MLHWVQVLDYDPVPRAMISADPYYQLALKNSVRINCVAVAATLTRPHASRTSSQHAAANRTLRANVFAAVQTLRNVLQFGQWVLGPNAPSPRKFLYRNVGDVFLLSVATPSEAVTPLSEHTLEKTLEMPLEDFVSRPALLLQTLLDHNHWSYTNDLMAAARLQQKREQRRVQQVHERSSGAARLRAQEPAGDTEGRQRGASMDDTSTVTVSEDGAQVPGMMTMAGGGAPPSAPGQAL